MNKFSLILIFLLTHSTFGATGINARAVCEEKEESLLKTFLPTEFGVARSTVGQDQVDSLKARIREFISSQRDVRFTKIAVNSMSARLPFYITQNGRQVIDPQSDSRNSALARQRAEFAHAALLEIKQTNPELRDVNIEIQSGLEGPAFTPIDLNDRFVVSLTPNYRERVQAIFQENQELYEQKAMLKIEDLQDTARFENLYQVKFRPFQGFRLEIFGAKKCLDNNRPANQVIKQ